MNRVLHGNDKGYSDCIHIGFPSSTWTMGYLWGSSAVSDLVGHEFEEKDYLVVDYESALQTAKSTTDR
ncbi:hypothetical protein [Oryza sativa Japonica Group]|uniref:Uncharacterized protein n=1 Tax=Oryza sativa subsp. japonica TaxID=39947 RepID=Q5ZAH6_ORYSJ|nr:hypothetical protein [Oryza sativa Japonica Group]BAD53404.1 hypothetical protein [Oryza sativa Japonica Group]